MVVGNVLNNLIQVNIVPFWKTEIISNCQGILLLERPFLQTRNAASNV
jgi:hypothetical protein